jgi:hypothetical protein
MPHPIDHQALREAAGRLLTIADSGYTSQLRSEFHFRIREAGIINRWTDPLQETTYDNLAATLAEVTDSPIGQCKAAVREAAGAMPRRDIGLKLLAELASECRRVMVEASRQRMQPRRSA